MGIYDDFISEKIKLPSPPAVAIKILQAVRNDDNSFDELASIIMTDPALTARVLKIANSQLYGNRGNIESLQQATSLIGTNALRNIALSFVIVDQFSESPQESFDIEFFWRRAVTSAVAAEVLASELQQKDKDLFISALLQDIGVLLLFLAAPVKYSEMRDEKRITKKATHALEKDYFGCNHAEVGGLLLESWNLPKSIVLPIKHHHSAADCEKYSETANILRLSGMISAIFTGYHGSSKAIDFQQELIENFNWPVEKTVSVIDLVGEKAVELLDLFGIDPGETKPLSVIMQDVIDELGRLNLSYEQMVLELKQAKDNAEQLARELKTANDSLRKLAYRDGLTGLYNHRYFQEVLEAELDRTNRYKNPLSLLFIDIDFFKKVNDTYGHIIGDQVLQEISQQLTKLVRKCDLVSRYGGEEFTVIMPETTLSSARTMAQRLRRGIEQHKIQLKDNSISVTISIGLICTELLSEEQHRSVIIDMGDQALYQAKRKGRNTVQTFAVTE